MKNLNNKSSLIFKAMELLIWVLLNRKDGSEDYAQRIISMYRENKGEQFINSVFSHMIVSSKDNQNSIQGNFQIIRFVLYLTPKIGKIYYIMLPK